MVIIDVKGHEGYYIDLADLYSKRIVWNNGNYVFSISATYNETYKFDKEKLFEIAGSVGISKQPD